LQGLDKKFGPGSRWTNIFFFFSESCPPNYQTFFFYFFSLLHIAGVTGSNKSFSVAFAFPHEETEEYYKWALQSLLNVFTSNNIPIPEAVLTNREQALMNGLDSVFPTTTHLLCTWHINKNLVSNGAKMIKDKKKEAEMIQHWNNVINITTTGDFRAAFDRFAGSYGEKFGKYMHSNWLPVAEKYPNAWTREMTHFNHRTKSQIKSSHSFVKAHLLGSNQSLNSTIKMITNAIEAQVHEISTLHCQEKINALMNLGALFDNCLSRITHFDLRKAQNNLRLSASVGKNDHCNGFHRLQTGILCKHCLAELAWSGGKLEPEDFHQQWHIHVCLLGGFMMKL
jgi:hypothetical protein